MERDCCKFIYEANACLRSNFLNRYHICFLQGRPTVVGSNLTDDAPSLASAVQVVLLSNGGNSMPVSFYIPYFILHIYVRNFL